MEIGYWELEILQMVFTILTWLSSTIISIISSTGYLGVMILMTLESACVPVPSEIIMPFSGFLVWEGKFILWQVIVWGAIGNLIGSIIAYLVGFFGGRRLILRYGKYFLVSEHDLEMADNWFRKYGQGVVFFSRLLPVVRTFISLPAGIARMDFKKFCFYTLLGSLLWSFALAFVGFKAGENWDYLKTYFHRFDIIFVILIAGGIIWWVWRHVVRKQKTVNN